MHFFAREERVSEHTSGASVHTAQSAVCEGGLALTKAGQGSEFCVVIIWLFSAVCLVSSKQLPEEPNVVRRTPCPALGGVWGGDPRYARVGDPEGLLGPIYGLN